MAAHRYWRINLVAAANNAFAFAEIQFRTTAGTSLAFSGGTPSAFSVISTFTAAQATDGNTTTFYAGNLTPPAQWWMYDFSATSGNWRDVVEISMTARNDASFTQAPSLFFPEWSDDGSSWNGMAPLSAEWTSAGQTKLFSVRPLSSTDTTWNPSDKNANTVLSNGNLSAAVSGSVPSGAGVRSADRQSSGKYYWEIVWNSTNNTADCTGVVNASGSLGATVATSGPRCIHHPATGNIYVNGAIVGATATAVSSGQILCIAYDVTAALAWFRIGAVATWNNSGTANPATAVGGINTASILSGSDCYPYVQTSATADLVTANFGDSAFVGAVPAGFTAGWPKFVAAASTQARAMVLA